MDLDDVGRRLRAIAARGVETITVMRAWNATQPHTRRRSRDLRELDRTEVLCRQLERDACRR